MVTHHQFKKENVTLHSEAAPALTDALSSFHKKKTTTKNCLALCVSNLLNFKFVYYI